MSCKDLFLFIILIILSSYFLVGYLLNFADFLGWIKEFFLLFVIFLGGFVNILNVFYVKRIDRTVFYVLVYVLLVLILITFSSFFAQNPFYSFVRAVYSFLLFFLMFWTFWFIRSNMRFFPFVGHYISFSLLCIGFIAIVGQILISDWQSGVGGIRLSGGVNPNFIAFIGLFMVYWFNMNSLKVGWGWKEWAGCLLGVLIVVLSLSRTIILSLVCLYVCYMFLVFIRNKCLLKRHLFYGVAIFSSLLLVFVAFSEFVVDEQLLFYLNSRILDLQNINSRFVSWDVLWAYFRENILWGTAGWWNSTNILSEYGENVANSPHSLYVRVLSEVGLIGLFVILLFPVFLCLKLFLKAKRLQKMDYKFSNACLFVFAMIVTLMLSQVFRDQYLVGFKGGLQNGIFVWVFVEACYIIKKSQLIKNNYYLNDSSNKLNR